MIQSDFVLGFYRVKSGFTESAHYAHYLVFVYAITDIVNKRGYPFFVPGIFKAVIVLVLITTFSLSGFIMIIGYIGIAYFTEHEGQLIQKISSAKLWTYLILLFTAVVVVWPYVGSDIAEFIKYGYGRLEQAVTALQLGLVRGSEAARVSSATVLFDYWTSQNLLHVLVGEGYAHYDTWLIQNYSGGSFATGDLHNVLSAVGISIGTIGVTLYILFLYTILKIKSKVPIALICTWVIYHFATGHLIGYEFWWPILVGTLIISDREGRPWVVSR